MKSYAEKLKDPRWQKKRLEILERDGWKCRRCQNKDDTLNVHHLIYEAKKAPWEYPPALLISLCTKCHDDVEDRTNKILRAQLALMPWPKEVMTQVLLHLTRCTDTSDRKGLPLGRAGGLFMEARDACCFESLMLQDHTQLVLDDHNNPTVDFL